MSVSRRNPLLPLNHHVPDCEAHVMPDGRLCLYGSYDLLSSRWCSTEYHVVTTEDLEHWTVHPTAFRGEDVPWFGDPDAPKCAGIDWEHPTPFMRKVAESRTAEPEPPEAAEKEPEPPLLYAPDCLYRNGKYYLYFCMSDNSEGVAVSDNPAGPFTDPVQLPCEGIDPAVFTDDDGQVYYYWGQLHSHGARLRDDMISLDPASVTDRLLTEETHFFHEGSSLRKIGDTYYAVYADMERGRPTSLGYATSDSPLGPFTYRGIIVDNADCDPQSWNNHGSIECVNGQWYVFYHRSSRNSQMYRRLCAEKIQILPDGSIPEVRMTSQGIGEPFGPGEPIMGYQACAVRAGCFIDADEDRGEKLTRMSAGCSAVFRYVRSGAGWRRITVTARGEGSLAVLLNGRSAGTVEVCGSRWAPFTADLSAPAGEAELTLEALRGENLEIAEIVLE